MAPPAKLYIFVFIIIFLPYFIEAELTVLTLNGAAVVPGVAIVVLLLGLLFTRMAGATPIGGCLSNLDCSLNGECDAASGQCKCDAGWKGIGCASLDLALQTPDAMLNETNMSTWGAPAVFAEHTAPTEAHASPWIKRSN